MGRKQLNFALLRIQKNTVRYDMPWCIAWHVERHRIKMIFELSCLTEKSQSYQSNYRIGNICQLEIDSDDTIATVAVVPVAV